MQFTLYAVLMSCHNSGFVCMQDWLVPIRAVMDSQWHTPKAPGSRSMQTLNLKLSDVQFQPAFGHIPLIHTATQLIKASRAPVAVNDQQPIPIAVPIAESAAPATPLTETLSETLASPLSATADLAPHLSIASAASVASTVAAASVASVTVARAAVAHTHAPFRPSCMHVTADIESLAGALVDDRYGHPIEVMAVRLQVRLCPVPCMPYQLRCHAFVMYMSDQWL